MATKKRYCGPCDKWVPGRETVCKACGASTDKADRQLSCGLCGEPSGNTDTCVPCMTRIIKRRWAYDGDAPEPW